MSFFLNIGKICIIGEKKLYVREKNCTKRPENFWIWGGTMGTMGGGLLGFF